MLENLIVSFSKYMNSKSKYDFDENHYYKFRKEKFSKIFALEFDIFNYKKGNKNRVIWNKEFLTKESSIRACRESSIRFGELRPRGQPRLSSVDRWLHITVSFFRFDHRSALCVSLRT